MSHTIPMNRSSRVLAVGALLAASLLLVACSRDEEPKPVPPPVPVAVAQAPETRSATPVVPAPANVMVDPFGNPVRQDSGTPEVLVKEMLPASFGPVATKEEAWKTGEAALKHYGSMNGFTEEDFKTFYLKHAVENADHFRLMMFGVLPGGSRYIAIKVYRDGRAELLPDEM